MLFQSLFRYKRCLRITTKSGYQRVFRQSKKLTTSAFLVLHCPNQSGNARIGMAISRKHTASAVLRNYTKRVIREQFRLLQQNLPAVDIIIVSRPNLKCATKLQHHVELKELWQKLIDLYD